MTKPPLSDDLVAKARAVVAGKQVKAMARANGDSAEAARLLWQWTRQDTNLATSILRVYCAGAWSGTLNGDQI